MFPMRSVLLFIVLTSCGCNYSVSEYIQPPDELESEKLKSSNNILEPGEICLTKTCNDTALKISKNMDLMAAPCDDFYQFVCGGYMKSADIPDQTMKIFVNHLEMSLKEPIKQNEPRPLKMVKNYYKSCMNGSAIEENSVKSLLQLINKSFGGWPLIEGDKWDETNFDWIECISEMQRKGFVIDNMPRIKFENNANNRNKRVISVWRQNSDIFFSRRADNETIDIVREDLINITLELGADRTFAEKEVRELFSFVSKIYDLDEDEIHSEHKFENFWARLDLFSASSLEKNIEKLILPFSNIDEDIDVIWTNSNNKLRTLMEKTPKRVQANYIIWCFISQNILSLKNDIRVKYGKLLEDGLSAYSIRKYPSRTAECVINSAVFMPVSLLASYIRNNFNRNLKNDITRISENIGKQILKNLDSETSLSPYIKDILRDRIEEVKTSIAYDGDFFNDTELEELDKDLNISDDYLHNNINLMKLIMKIYVSISNEKKISPFKLSSSNDNRNTLWDSLKDKREWKGLVIGNFNFLDGSVSEKKALLNTLMTTAASFQSTMSNIENPEYIKYGTTGSILGHELYWGVERLRDTEDPKSKEISWDDASKGFFSRRDDCLVDQHNIYLLVDSKLNWRPSFKKNIADIGGIKAAYLAYSNWASNRKPELMLYNLSYTPKQMFWISAMNNFCGEADDPFSSKRFKIKAPFINMPEFAEDFKCPAKSEMNPWDKCSII